MIYATIEIVIFIVDFKWLSDLEVSHANRFDRRIFFDGSKIFYDQHDYSASSNCIILYCNITKGIIEQIQDWYVQPNIMLGSHCRAIRYGRPEIPRPAKDGSRIARNWSHGSGNLALDKINYK